MQERQACVACEACVAWRSLWRSSCAQPCQRAAVQRTLRASTPAKSQYCCNVLSAPRSYLAVPAQMWQGVSPVPVQMWLGRAQTRCRCGSGGRTARTHPAPDLATPTSPPAAAAASSLAPPAPAPSVGMGRRISPFHRRQRGLSHRLPHDLVAVQPVDLRHQVPMPFVSGLGFRVFGWGLV